MEQNEQNALLINKLDEISSDLKDNTKSLNSVLIEITKINTIQNQQNKDIAYVKTEVKDTRSEVIQLDKEVTSVKTELGNLSNTVGDMKNLEKDIKKQLKEINNIQVGNKPFIDNQKKINWLVVTSTVTFVVVFIGKIFYDFFSK